VDDAEAVEEEGGRMSRKVAIIEGNTVVRCNVILWRSVVNDAVVGPWQELRSQLAGAREDEFRQRAEPFLGCAEIAHGLFCTDNHTDGYSWEYEKHSGADAWCFGSESKFKTAHCAWLDKVMFVAKTYGLDACGMEEILVDLAKASAKYEKLKPVMRAMVLGLR
jgi:hypothetical protein